MGHNQPAQDQPEIIATATVRSESENKKFFFDLKKNGRGVVLKVTEQTANGRRNTIMIPADALNAACDAMDEMFTALPE